MLQGIAHDIEMHWFPAVLFVAMIPVVQREVWWGREVGVVGTNEPYTRKKLVFTSCFLA